mgnify:CR=1 FL=1
MPDLEEDGKAKAIIQRAEYHVRWAQHNATRHGGDDATAAADLMMAFVLISIRNGADPDRAIDAMRHDAIAACSLLWDRNGRRLDA